VDSGQGTTSGGGAEVTPPAVQNDSDESDAGQRGPDVSPSGGDGPPTSPAGRDSNPVSRAGRELGSAIGVGLGLGGLVLATLLLYPDGFVVIVAIAVLVGLWELVRALEAEDTRQPVLPLALGSLSMIVLTYLRGTDGLVVSFMITVLACLVWRLADGARGYLRDISTTVFIATYVPLLAAFAVLLVRPDDGPSRVLAFIVTVVCSDVGGYLAGVLLGRHRLAPSVSPKKSWEGLAGSMLFCAVGGALLLTLALDGRWWQGAVFGLAIAATATLGDLGESMIKRDLGRKDMGSLLPGHGGMMDRLDSLLPSAAVAWILLSYFVPLT